MGQQLVRDFGNLVDGGWQQFKARHGAHGVQDVVQVFEEDPAQPKAQPHAKNSDADAVPEKNPHHLPVRGSEGFEQPDLLHLVHGKGDLGIHDGKGGDNHDHEEDDVHHHFLRREGVENPRVLLRPDHETVIRAERAAEFPPRLIHGERVVQHDVEAVNLTVQVIEILRRLQRRDDHHAVEVVVAHIEDAAHREVIGHHDLLALALRLVPLGERERRKHRNVIADGEIQLASEFTPHQQPASAHVELAANNAARQHAHRSF